MSSQNQVRFTIGDAEMDLVRLLANRMGTKLSEAALFVFRLGVPEAEKFYRSLGEKEDRAEIQKLRSLILRLINGEWIDNGELCEFAHSFDLDATALTALRNKVGRRNGNGDANQVGQKSD